MRQLLAVLVLVSFASCQSKEETTEHTENERGALQDYVETPKEKAHGVKQRLEGAQKSRDQQLDEE